MDGAGPPGEAPVSRHGASRTWHTSCSLEAQLAGYRAAQIHRCTDPRLQGPDLAGLGHKPGFWVHGFVRLGTFHAESG